MRLPLPAALLAAKYVVAESHHLFVSSFTSPHVYSLSFNDETKNLTQTGHTLAHDGHPWMSFSYDKSALYAGERDGFASYSVESSTALSYKRSVQLKGACAGQNSKIAADSGGSRTGYILPLLKWPFTVYGAPSGNCLNAMSVEADGTLFDTIQNLNLPSSNPRSSIAGMAVDPENNILYSADDAANGIYLHQIVQESGELKQLAFVQAPAPNSGPRHLIVHPNGRYLYVVMQAKNEVVVYAVNNAAGAGARKITFTGLRYSLVPRGSNAADFQANEVVLSADNNILFISTQHRAKSAPGFVTAILLIPISERQNPEEGHSQGPGFPLRQLFQVKTTTSGGMSNAVSPAPWDKDYFAITDSEIGQVEIWKIDGAKTDKAYYAGTTGRDALTPAKGGWENGAWVDNPAAVVPKNPGGSGSVPVSTPNPNPSNPWQQGPGYQPSGWNPYQEGSGDRPSNPFQGGGGGGYRGSGSGSENPWGGSWGGYDYGDGEPDRGNRGGRGGRGGDNGEDDDERRKQGRDLYARQAAGSTPAAPPPAPVTVRLVATWKAPQGATPKMRRTRLQTRQSVNSTVPAGGCCANALWYD